ncbi:MAG: hypothetical protein EYC70_05010 [Planctomycetota bacterium]|nr:MAG: hypothetical protein EYC70_05010 [Planctomycetota bacterium]
MSTSSRAASAARQAWLSALLLLGVLAAALLLLARAPARLDLTAEREYSLAPATRALLARLEDRLQVKLYFNRDIEGAEVLLPARIVVENLLAELAAASGGRMVVETVDPTTDPLSATHAREVGIQPISLPTGDVGSVRYTALYQGLEMRYQDRGEVIPFVVPAELEYAFAARLAQLLAARRPVIGVFSREPEGPPEFPGMPLPPPPPERVYAELRQVLAQRYGVRDVRLDAGSALHEELAALVVAQPQDMTAREVYELDQYLARGGHALVLLDHERYTPGADRSFQREALVSGLETWLRGHGVHVATHLLWDERGYPVAVAEERQVLPTGRENVSEIKMPYGLWPRLEADSFAADNVATAGQQSLFLFWAHPTAVDQAPAGLRAEVLLRSSARSWLLPNDVTADWNPENIDSLKRQALSSGPASSWPLAVALRGSFPAQFDADAVPQPDAAAAADAQPAPEPAAHVSALAPGLLVVIGDADLFQNAFLEPGWDNALFAESLIDWLAQDESLIELRSRGARERPLRSFYREYVEARGGLPEAEAQREELDRAARRSQLARQRAIAWGNVLAPPLLLALLGLAHWRYWKRRSARPYRPRGGGAA